MARGDVADLVRQHAGHFLGRVGGLDQALHEHDAPAWHREGVDHRMIDHTDPQRIGQIQICGQAIGHPVKRRLARTVTADLRPLAGREFEEGLHLIDDRVAQLLFPFGRDQHRELSGKCRHQNENDQHQRQDGAAGPDHGPLHSAMVHLALIQTGADLLDRLEHPPVRDHQALVAVAIGHQLNGAVLAQSQRAQAGQRPVGDRHVLVGFDGQRTLAEADHHLSRLRRFTVEVTPCRLQHGVFFQGCHQMPAPTSTPSASANPPASAA